MLWEHIDSHDLRVEVVKGMESRLPPTVLVDCVSTDSSMEGSAAAADAPAAKPYGDAWV